MTINNKKMWTLFFIASVSIVLLSTSDIYAIHETEDPDDHSMHEDVSHDNYFTDANPKTPVDRTMMTYSTVHDMSLVVIYESTQGILHSKDFTYYSQVSGFDRSNDGSKSSSDKPTFILEGIVTPNHQPLYDMVDYVWAMQDVGYKMKYGQSDFYIGLVQDDIPVRVFKYTDCKIMDYKVDTLYDGVFTYDPNGGGARAFVDHFTYECSGFKPLNHESIKEAKSDITAKLQNNVKKISNGSIKAETTKSPPVSYVLPENMWNKHN